MLKVFCIRSFAIIALTFLPGLALAEIKAPTLKAEAAVASDVVRIGDLVDGAGLLADIAVFRAPDLGHTGTVEVHRVVDALRRHGLANVGTRGVLQVAVTRLSRSIGPSEIKERIAETLAGQRGLGEARNLAVTLDREFSLHIEPAAGDIKVFRAWFDPLSSRFDATFDVPGNSASRRVRFTGTITETVEVAVLLRPADRGDTIHATDIITERRAKSPGASGALTAEQIAGLAARRPLRAGQPLRASDLMRPELVRQNALVTVTYEVPGINLTLRGKALESGAEGDVINVLNVQTKRTLQGTVSGANRVSIAATTAQVEAAGRAARSSVAAAARQQRVE